MLSDSDREQVERGSLILNRLVPAPDHGAGFRRDPETGFVYYSSEWLSDGRKAICPACHNEQWRYPHNCTDGPPRR
jgi:hypothetical protein